MALKSLLLALLATFILLPSGQAQLITTVPTPAFSATTIVTVSEESFYTNYVQAVSTFTTFETTGATAALAVETQVVIGGLQETDVALVQGYIINNFSDENYALCWFPTSGNWARLPRIIFYGTIVFALVARSHEWLVAGALAASLTFSGVAAIQMCLQVWTRQMVAELDFFALLGILGTSCIIAMPLLNWSSTIRYLGQSEQDKRARHSRDQQIKEMGELPDEHHQIRRETYGPTRTVIVFWALLVAIGFLSGFAALMEIRYSNADYMSIYTNSGVDSIRCVPDNNTLNLEAGQFEHWESFWVTAEFVSANHCENPCTALPEGQWTLFRSPSKDLQALTAREIDDLIYQSAISHREEHALEFTRAYYSYMLFGLPFIVVQGFLHFFMFRRHSPQDARQKIYLLIVGENPAAVHPFVRGVALTLSLSFYFFAVLILLLTPLILALNVVATELFMYIFPQSEYNKHVGQWSVAAGTLLVLLAAMLCRHDAGAWYFWNETKKAVRNSFSRWRHSWRGRRHDAYRKQSDAESDPPNLQRKGSFRPHQAFLKIFKDLMGAVGNIILDIYDYFAWTVKDFYGLFKHEWALLVFFWRNPRVTPPASLMYREKPEMPRSRRKVTKSYDNSGSTEKFQTHPVVRYELREYPVDDISGNGIKTYSVISEAQPMSINEIEQPFLTNAHLSGSNVAIQSRQSQALSKQESIYNQISATSAPQSPLLSPIIQQNGHFYRLVPSQTNSPHLSTGQADSNAATPRTHLFVDAPFRASNDPMTVTGSLSTSIAARSRRSDVYSPAPEQTQPIPPFPQQDSTSHQQSSPKSDVLKDLPQTPSIRDFGAQAARPTPQTNLPPLSTRTSNLFSEDEIANLYRNGTPKFHSVVASRSSLANFPSNSGLSAEARGISGTGRVSYLQIQSGRDLSNAEAWGDQLTLQRDRYGRWVIVDAPDAVELPAGRISEADDEGEDEVRPREW